MPSEEDPITWKNDPALIPKSIEQKATYWPAFHLGIGFFLVFAALMPTQNLLTSLNGSLGYFSIAAIYFGMSLFGPFAPYAVSRLGGVKKALVAGAFTYLVFQVANILTGVKEIPSTASYVILLPPSGFLGIGACILWTAEGIYASRVASSVDLYQRSLNQQQSEGVNSLGYVNGLVLLFLQSANLIMNLASSALLSSGVNAVVLFVILGVASGLGFAFLLFLPPASAQEGRDRDQTSLMDSLRGVYRLQCDSNHLAFLSLFVVTGLNQGFLFSTLTGDIIKPSLGTSWVGYVMATSAAVDALGSYAFGWVSDKFGRGPVLLLGGIVNLVPCVLVLVFGVPDSAYVLCFTNAILLGIADAVWMTICSAMIPECFEEVRTTSVFASFTMWRSFMTAALSLLGPFLPLAVRTAILGVSVVLSGVVYLFARPQPMAERLGSRTSIDVD